MKIASTLLTKQDLANDVQAMQAYNNGEKQKRIEKTTIMNTCNSGNKFFGDLVYSQAADGHKVFESALHKAQSLHHGTSENSLKISQK